MLAITGNLKEALQPSARLRELRFLLVQLGKDGTDIRHGFCRVDFNRESVFDKRLLHSSAIREHSVQRCFPQIVMKISRKYDVHELQVLRSRDSVIVLENSSLQHEIDGFERVVLQTFLNGILGFAQTEIKR